MNYRKLAEINRLKWNSLYGNPSVLRIEEMKRKKEVKKQDPEVEYWGIKSPKGKSSTHAQRLAKMGYRR